MFTKISEIFDVLKTKTNLKIFDLKAPNIRIYNRQSLNFPFQGYGFCIPETRKVLKEELPYETGSIFYDDKCSIEELNNKLDESYSKDERSSSHYLSPFIHEIMHGVYVDYIYKNMVMKVNARIHAKILKRTEFWLENNGYSTAESIQQRRK